MWFGRRLARSTSSSSEPWRPSSLSGVPLLPSYSGDPSDGTTFPSVLLLDMASDSARALLIMVGNCLRRALMNQLEIWSVTVLAFSLPAPWGNVWLWRTHLEAGLPHELLLLILGRIRMVEVSNEP